MLKSERTGRHSSGNIQETKSFPWQFLNKVRLKIISTYFKIESKFNALPVLKINEMSLKHIELDEDIFIPERVAWLKITKGIIHKRFIQERELCPGFCFCQPLKVFYS